jgi:acetyl esterase/lipase
MLIVGLAACLSITSPSSAKRALTVDDYLNMEDFGQAMFAPSGTDILFEKQRPYKDAPDYSSNLALFGVNRGTIHIAPLDDLSAARPLFVQSVDRGYWLGSFSPGKSKVVIYSYDADRAHIGIYDFQARTYTEYADQPRVLSSTLPTAAWLSEQALLYSALPDGAFIMNQNYFSDPTRRRQRAREIAWQGTAATASTIGSGRYLPEKKPAGSLLRLDLQTGKTEQVLDGLGAGVLISPDRKKAVFIREAERLKINWGRGDGFGANTTRRLEMLVLDLGGGPPVVDPCEDCDIMGASVRWSPDSSKVAFVAREPGQIWDEAELHLYDLGDTTARKALPAGVALHTLGRSMTRSASLEWLGPRGLAFWGAAEGGSPPTWYLLDDVRAAMPLVSGLDNISPVPLAVHKRGLLLEAGGDAWLVPSRDHAVTHKLTTDISGRVMPAALAVQQTGDAFQVMGIAKEDGNHVLVLNMDTGTSSILEKENRESRVLAVAPESGRYLSVRQGPDGAHLALGGKGGAEFMHLNAYMADVAGTVPVAIEHTDPDHGTLVDWLVLPPDYQTGQKLPLVVIVYPGAVFGKTWHDPYYRFSELTTRPHILAANGFAVLRVSMPTLPYDTTPRDPMTGFEHRVDAAIDQVIARGYADADHIGLMGHSYGGYTTQALLTQSKRFKAAVAMAGLSNLTSAYGAFDDYGRGIRDDGLMFFGARWSEFGQGAMGGPPWEDPGRYIRNSPLFSVQEITTPLMLIHGGLDAVVPMSQSEEMFTALSRLDRDAVFIRYWGEEHNLKNPHNIRHKWAQILDWFNRYLR